jgi:anthranilate phosphoribosyltransferase
MLKEKNEQYDKNADHQNTAVQREKIEALIGGSLGPEEILTHLRALSSALALHQLDQETFNSTIDIVRATALPGIAQLFKQSGNLIDCCGTGGSGLSHYNTSTTVAFILAAAGLKVAKFGNRAASSLSGSFDLLDKLGIGTTLQVHALPEILEQTNLAFLFAPQFYPALAPLAPLRQLVGSPTVFNYIGPLLNPAVPVFRLLGVPNKHVQDLVASHLQTDGKVEHALVVNSESGMDELDVHSANTIVRVKGNKIERETLAKMPLLQLDGKEEGPLSADSNKYIFDALISGELGGDNYYHALVCLNTGSALSAAGLADNLEAGVKIAANLLKDGSVKAKFIQYQAQFK